MKILACGVYIVDAKENQRKANHMKKALVILLLLLLTFSALGEGEKIVSQEEAAAYFPGYTLRHYWTWGEPPFESGASYTRVENGVLYVRSAVFVIGKPADVVDSMPVPLSQQVLSRLESEPFENVLPTQASLTNFSMRSTFDTQKIPVTDTVLDSHLQSEALLLLTENANGERCLRIVTEKNGAYSVTSTPPLPTDVCMDLSHARDGNVMLCWDDYHMIASFEWRAEGDWRLYWLQDHRGFYFKNSFCGAQTTISGFDFFDCDLVGSHDFGDLLTTDLNAIPRTKKDLLARLDTTGWALVNNPNPADRLNLRAEDSQKAELLGRFYNGTPVKVLRERGAWCYVQIGTERALKGWMMKKYLAFGADMARVQKGFPRLMLTPEHENDALFLDDRLTQPWDGYDYAICGVSVRDHYILLNAWGEVIYAPQDWMYPGNG